MAAVDGWPAGLVHNCGGRAHGRVLGGRVRRLALLLGRPPMRGAILGPAGGQRRVYPCGAEGASEAFCARAPGCYVAMAAPGVAAAPCMRHHAPGVPATAPVAGAVRLVPPLSVRGGLVTG
jgi:hypothetical protein